MGDFNAMSIMGLGFGNQTVKVVAAALADIFLTIVSIVVGSSSWVMLPLIIARFLLLSEYHASLTDVCHKIICKMSCKVKRREFFHDILSKLLEIENRLSYFCECTTQDVFCNSYSSTAKILINIQIQTAEPRCKTSWVKAPPPSTRGCVSHTVALPFTLKSILMQKKN